LLTQISEERKKINMSNGMTKTDFTQLRRKNHIPWNVAIIIATSDLRHCRFSFLRGDSRYKT